MRGTDVDAVVQAEAALRYTPWPSDNQSVCFLIDADRARIAELLQRFLKEQSAGNAGPVTTGRAVGELLQAGEAYRDERARIEAEKWAEEKTRREREAAIAREKHLDSLVGREQKLWAEVDILVATKQPKKYDQAVKLLVDLRDLASRGKGSGFARRLDALREAHARKPSLIERLTKAGM